MNHENTSASNGFGRELRGFGPAGLLALLLILLTGNIMLKNMIVLPVGAILVLAWAKISRTPWREIGFSRPKSWLATLSLGLVLGIFLKFFMKAVIMPFLGAEAVNRYYHFLAGNESLLPAAIWAMLVAGFAEETVFRGYLFERLGKLFGNSRSARAGILLITSILFGLSHYFNQGTTGVIHAFITGLIFGSIYLLTKRIWLPIITHAAFDLTALTIIYWDLETAVARLFFD